MAVATERCPTMPATLQTSVIDLWSDENLRDPYPLFTELREQAAAVSLEQNDVWVITRYQQIRDVLGDWETFSSTKVAFNEKTNEILTGTTLASDPPLHTPPRAALGETPTPRRRARHGGQR